METKDPTAGDGPAASRPTSADPLRGLAWLLLFQVCGEVLARALGLPFPGPVVGMLLLMPALSLPMVREPVALCAEFLLRHLSLLFVPVGVGVMSHLDLLGHFGGRMLLVIVVSTWAGMVTTAWLLKRPDPADARDARDAADAPDPADPPDAATIADRRERE